LVAHVLHVAAFELGDPVLVFVLMKTDDAFLHEGAYWPRDLASSAATRCFSARSSCQRDVSSRIVAAMIHDD
jgi:hypothetical protein